MPLNPDPTFRTHRVREGYDLDEVDDFVDRVLDTLEGRAGTGALTAEVIEAHEFTAVRFRESYSMDDVDDWLDAAAAQLRTTGSPAQAPAQAPARPPAAPAPAATVPAARSADPEATQAWPAPQLVPAAAVAHVSVPQAAVAPALSPTMPPAPRPAPRELGGDALGDVLAGRPHAGAQAAPGQALRHPARTVASVPAPATGLHHLEIWVDDLAASTRSFGWLFERLGWTLFQVWGNGRAWQAPGRGPYVVVETSPAMVRQPYDRRRPGLNHLALAVPERWMVDRIVTEAPTYGWRLLFAEQHPYAGGPAHYAAYLENADGFEVEVVAS